MKKKTAALSIAKQTIRNLSQDQPKQLGYIGSLTSGSAEAGCCVGCGC